MSDILTRLRALDPEQTPNAALFEALQALDQRNQQLQRAMLLGLDEQDALAVEYVRLTSALLRRQGKPVPVSTAEQGPYVLETPLTDVWN